MLLRQAGGGAGAAGPGRRLQVAQRLGRAGGGRWGSALGVGGVWLLGASSRGEQVSGLRLGRTGAWLVWGFGGLGRGWAVVGLGLACWWRGMAAFECGGLGVV